MHIQGIAARLGLGSDALADTCGFAIRGDPRMGHIFVSIPKHFEELLNDVIRVGGGGFSFHALFPKPSQVPGCNPVLVYVERASTYAVRKATMALKNNKDLWFLFVVGFDFEGIDREARAEFRTALEFYGFKISKVTAMCYCKGTRIYNNMVYVKFLDIYKRRFGLCMS
eukprot:4569992-Pleurochrysis_carterae.AAC.1